MENAGGDVSLARYIIALGAMFLLLFSCLFYLSRLKSGRKFLARIGTRGGGRMSIVEVVRFDRASGVALVTLDDCEYICPFGTAQTPVVAYKNEGNAGEA
jgi:hypothetical protein